MAQYEKLKEKGIAHVCLRVPNLYKTKEFYEKALDAVVVAEWGNDENEDHAFIMDLGTGDYLEIFGSGKHWELGFWQHVAVWTDDISASIERAVACGAEKLGESGYSDIPCRSGQIVHMKYGFVKAPGGEIIEFIEDIPANK